MVQGWPNALSSVLSTVLVEWAWEGRGGGRAGKEKGFKVGYMDDKHIDFQICDVCMVLTASRTFGKGVANGVAF